MTHIDNISDIINVGIVLSTSPKANPNYIPIGDLTAIQTRNNKKLPDGSLIGDYIPFYFGPRSPMLYVIQHGYNNVKKLDAEDIVYCVVFIQDIIDFKIRCVFTDGHALNKITNIYTCEQLGDIDRYVSYDMVYAKKWTDEPDLKRKKEAELLIKEDIPPELIKFFLVFNESAFNKLLSLGIERSKIRITPSFYF